MAPESQWGAKIMKKEPVNLGTMCNSKTMKLLRTATVYVSLIYFAILEYDVAEHSGF